MYAKALSNMGQAQLFSFIVVYEATYYDLLKGHHQAF